MPTQKLTPPALIVLVLCLFTFAMSAVIHTTTFESLPHLEDEYAYLFQARTMARGDLVIDTPIPRRAFWQPFVIDRDGQRFGKYTPGWALLLAGGVAAGGGGAEWIVNALLSALTVAVVYQIGRALFSRDVGLIAAGLVAFSPAALLLNGTLMGHTAALCAGTLTLWAYLRFEAARAARGTRLFWAILCGLAAGLLIANRPLTALAFVLPVAFHAANRLFAQQSFADLRRFIGGHLVIAGLAGGLALLVPGYNIAATGDPTANLYTFVWSYDCVGFETCGRSGHTLEKAFRHTRFDLSLTAADLFGWQIGDLTDAARAHLLTESDTYPQVGFSWLLLPLGVALALRRRWWLGVVWLVGIIAAVLYANMTNGGSLLTDPQFGWQWVIAAIGWTLLPLVLLRDRTAAWTWMLVTTIALLLIFQLTYWVGSQRYSTRYYFEGLAAAALLSAVPLAWLSQRSRRFASPILYGALIGVLLTSLTAYSLPRIDVLRGYNQITRAQIDAVESRRDGDSPVLVIVTGSDVRWRAFGALMALTNPYLDNDTVVAWDYSGGTNDTVRTQLLQRFADRQIIDMAAEGNGAWFLDDDDATASP